MKTKTFLNLFLAGAFGGATAAFGISADKPAFWTLLAIFLAYGAVNGSFK